VVLRTFSPARAWRPAVVARLARTLGRMKTIVITGYLVQGKLATALREVVGEASWKGSEVKLPESRRRWDMAYIWNGDTVVVEFDGDEHYRNALKFKIDEEKDAAARLHGLRVVRIPYWVQLTSETLEYYFGLSAKIDQDFPHGFIETKIFPASFCELGAQRFHREYSELPSAIQTAVLSSLLARAAEHGERYVMPSFLRNAA